MPNPFNAYKYYPFKIPLRVRFFNLFRYLIKIPSLEIFLTQKLASGKNFWIRLIPPLYFYAKGSRRVVQRDGLNFQLDISRLLDHSIYFYKLNEPTWKNLFTFLQNDFIVFDVGANIGFLTLNFARLCPSGFVFSFEPDSQNFEELSKNISENNFKNIKAFKNALGARREKATLYKLYPNNPGANRILFEDSKSKESHGEESVEVLTLDDVTDKIQITRINLLKIDVEGFEIFVLQGARQSIEKWKPILFIELAEVNLQQHGLSALSLIEYIEGMSYEVKDARTMENIDRSKTDHHTDILCFPKKR